MWSIEWIRWKASHSFRFRGPKIGCGKDVSSLSLCSRDAASFRFSANVPTILSRSSLIGNDSSSPDWTPIALTSATLAGGRRIYAHQARDVLVDAALGHDDVAQHLLRAPLALRSERRLLVRHRAEALVPVACRPLEHRVDLSEALRALMAHVRKPLLHRVCLLLSHGITSLSPSSLFGGRQILRAPTLLYPAPVRLTSGGTHPSVNPWVHHFRGRT